MVGWGGVGGRDYRIAPIRHYGSYQSKTGDIKSTRCNIRSAVRSQRCKRVEHVGAQTLTKDYYQVTVEETYNEHAPEL